MASIYWKDYSKVKPIEMKGYLITMVDGDVSYAKYFPEMDEFVSDLGAVRVIGWAELPKAFKPVKQHKRNDDWLF